MPDDNLTLPHQPESNLPTGEPHSAIGRFILGEEIARGGMGAIHRATDTALQREVAVKVLQDRFPPDSPLARRFIEEAQITGQLQHPGIPPVYDLGTLPDGRPFLAMKLIQGKTLAELLANRAASAAGSNDDSAAPRDTRSLTRPGSPDLLPIFESICQAVGYAHTHGIIHRDLKPANVMVGAFGEVQVMDWGLAKQLASRAASAAGSSDTRSLTRHGSPERYNSPDDEPDHTTDHTADFSTDERTRAGQALGTPAFMPPEQARGEVDRVDCRSDVFGLGAILCAVLTGEPPFRARRSDEALDKAKRADLQDALTRLGDCGADAELVALCTRCLSADPADRPANAGEVATLVAAYRAHVEQRLRTAERERAAAEAKAIEQRKKRRVQLALAGALGMLLVGGLGFAWWDARRAETQARLEGEQQSAELAQKLAESERAAAVRQARGRVPELIEIAAALRRDYKFKQSEQTLKQAAELARTNGLDDLQPAVQQAQADLAFVVELDQIRMKRSVIIVEPGGKGYFDVFGAPEAYRAAFLKRGFDVLAAPEQAGADVAVSVVRTELLVALDDWAVLTMKDDAVRDAVLAAARGGERDSAMNAYRDPGLWANRERLQTLASATEADRLSPGLLVALAEVMTSQGVNPVSLLRHALSRYPQDFLIAFTLGQVRVARNEMDPEAVGAYRAARALRPDNLTVLNNLGNALRASGDLPGAIAAHNEAIRLDPNDATAHNNLAAALYVSGDLPGAIAACKQAIRLDPNFPKPHTNLGIFLEARGDLPGAIAAHKEAIRLDPNFAIAHNNLGVALESSGDLPGAIAAFREAIRLDPKYATAHNGLGTTLESSGDLPGAIAAYQDAIRIDPQYAAPHINLGNALKAQGDLPGAIASLKEAIRLDPKDGNAQNSLGAALYASGDLPGAIAAYKEAIRLDPKLARAYRNLGIALLASRDIPGAIAALQEALRLEPQSAMAHTVLGDALDASGDRPGAIAAYKEAIRIDPKFAPAHNSLGIALAKSGDLDGAIRSFEQAVELEPNYPPSRRNLAQARKLKAERDAKATQVSPYAAGGEALTAGVSAFGNWESLMGYDGV